jgi:hypothetical protein
MGFQHLVTSVDVDFKGTKLGGFDQATSWGRVMKL